MGETENNPNPNKLMSLFVCLLEDRKHYGKTIVGKIGIPKEHSKIKWDSQGGAH